MTTSFDVVRCENPASLREEMACSHVARSAPRPELALVPSAPTVLHILRIISADAQAPVGEALQSQMSTILRNRCSFPMVRRRTQIFRFQHY